jgi:signal transduction histidine kinase
MIDRLSLATKFENGDLAPIVSQFNIYELTQDVLTTFEDKYKDRDFELRGKDTLIKADKTMIEMVLINLIDNAVKYSEDTIFIEIDETSLHVKDKGIGINEKDIEKVTNKFYRSNTLSWDNSIGLGLALVKHILTLHHTSLQIQSKPGFGSDFSFTFR